MYCSNCGEKINDGADVCLKCGHKVKKDEDKVNMNNSGFNIQTIPNEYRPISMWGYFGYEILFMIPFNYYCYLIYFYRCYRRRNCRINVLKETNVYYVKTMC